MRHFSIVEATYCPGTEKFIELKKCRECVWNRGVHDHENELTRFIDCGVDEQHLRVPEGDL